MHKVLSFAYIVNMAKCHFSNVAFGKGGLARDGREGRATCYRVLGKGFQEQEYRQSIK